MLSRPLALALAVLALHAGAGEAVRVDSALLRTLDAGVLEVGPGLYLPESAALELATEVRGCRERPASAVPAPAPAPTGVVTALVVGLLVGVVAGGAVVLVALR